MERSQLPDEMGFGREWSAAINDDYRPLHRSDLASASDEVAETRLTRKNTVERGHLRSARRTTESS
jgi:hypothetical protein